MRRHKHRHTHEVPNPGQVPVHPDVDHDHDHDDRMNEHHHYTEEPEEPAVAVMGPITPGLWMLAAPDRGEPMSREHPGEPGHPAYIYVTRAAQEVVIAYIAEPTYLDPGTPDRLDGPVEAETGDWEANAKLLTSSPALLRFVQSLASYQGVGVPDLAMKDRALALIEQLNHVEVRR